MAIKGCFPRSLLPHNLDNLKMSHKILCMRQICPQGNNSGWSWAADAPLGPLLSGCAYFFYGVPLAGPHSKELQLIVSNRVKTDPELLCNINSGWRDLNQHWEQTYLFQPELGTTTR